MKGPTRTGTVTVGPYQESLKDKQDWGLCIFCIPLLFYIIVGVSSFPLILLVSYNKY